MRQGILEISTIETGIVLLALLLEMKEGLTLEVSFMPLRALFKMDLLEVKRALHWLPEVLCLTLQMIKIAGRSFQVLQKQIFIPGDR